MRVFSKNHGFTPLPESYIGKLVDKWSLSRSEMDKSHEGKVMVTGFTLIELLVVIAIISILTSVILGSLSTARINSREGIRVENLRTLQTALELYYTDYGRYPKTFEPEDISTMNGHPNPPGSGIFKECAGHPNDYIPGLAPKYIAKLPSDPALNCGGVPHSWVYASDGIDYKLITHPELGTIRTVTDPAWDNGSNDCILDGYPAVHYGVWTPGAVCWRQ